MTHAFQIYLGDTIRTARQDRGLTLRDLSARAMVSLGYLSDIERADKTAHPDIIQSICDALDIRYTDLLRAVADSMDLWAQDVVHWQDETTATVPRIRAGSAARP